MLFAVAVAFPRSISLPGTYKRLKGAVSTSDKYTAPATRAALSVGCIGFFVRPARSFRFSAWDVGSWALGVCFIPGIRWVLGSGVAGLLRRGMPQRMPARSRDLACSEIFPE